jgi:hypothetical protein
MQDGLKNTASMSYFNECMKILLCDQFYGPNPYLVDRTKLLFLDLINNMLESEWPPSRIGTKPQVLDVDEYYQLPMCSTAWREGEEGCAVLWKCRWDSSG